MRPPGRVRSVSPLTSITRSSPTDSSSSCSRRAEPSASAAHDDAVTSPSSSASCRTSRFAVADHRVPAHRLTTWSSGRSAIGSDGPGARRRVREQPVEGRGAGAGTRCPSAPQVLPSVARGRPPRPGCRRPGRACGGARPAGPARRRRAGRTGRARRGVSHGSHDSMPSNVRPSASRSHCSRPHGSAPTRAAARARTSSVGSSSRHGKDLDLGEVGRRALVVHGELGEAVDLVAPQVDAHRHVGGRREHVDDRAADRDLAAVLDLVLAPVAGCTSSATSSSGSTCSPGRMIDRLDVLDVGAEPLRQRPHGRDDERGRALGLAQPPHRPQPPAHRLDAGAHPLERQRLPRREQLDLVRGQVHAQVVRDALGRCARREQHQERPLARERSQAGERDRAGRLGDRHGRRPAPEQVRDCSLLAQQRGEVSQTHFFEGSERTPQTVVAGRRREDGG